MIIFELVVFVFVFALFGSFSPAAAYIDPAATSYVVQIIAAMVIIGGAAIGYYWQKVKNKVKKPSDADTGASAEEQLTKKNKE